MGRHEPKPHYAPTPMRAIGDKRLTGEQLRVLMAVAAHDRFNKNGKGCCAWHTTLAREAKCWITSLSRSLKILAKLGYIEILPSPDGKRRRAYRVVYNDADAVFMESPGATEPHTDAHEVLIDDGDDGSIDTNLGMYQGAGHGSIDTNLGMYQGSIDTKVDFGTQQKQGLTAPKRLGETLSEENSAEAAAADAAASADAETETAYAVASDDAEDAGERKKKGRPFSHNRQPSGLHTDAHDFEPFNPPPDLSVLAGLDLCPLLAGKPRRFTAVIGGRA